MDEAGSSQTWEGRLMLLRPDSVHGRSSRKRQKDTFSSDDEAARESREDCGPSEGQSVRMTSRAKTGSGEGDGTGS